jgi:hypothetical protein
VNDDAACVTNAQDVTSTSATNQPEETTFMLRKTVIALAALAALGSAALAPTAASAHGFKFRHGFGFGPHWGFYGGPHYFPSNCTIVKKFTPFGVRFIKVCDVY